MFGIKRVSKCLRLVVLGLSCQQRSREGPLLPYRMGRARPTGRLGPVTDYKNICGCLTKEKSICLIIRGIVRSIDVLLMVLMMSKACVCSIRSNTNRLNNLMDVIKVICFKYIKVPKVEI